MLLSACGGGGSGSDDSSGGGEGSVEEQTVSGSVSLGPVAGATVGLYRADEIDFSIPLADQQGLLLASTETDQEGAFSSNGVGDYDGPLLLVVSVDGSSRYYDEASGSEVSFPDSRFFPDSTFFPDSGSDRHVLFAMLPAPTDDVGVTTLTTAAVARAAAANPSTLDAAAVDQFNEAIRAALSPQLQSILSEPSLFNSNTTTASFGRNEADQYALLLAAFAGIADSESAPAFAFLQALIDDLDDGTIDSGGTFYSNFSEFLVAWQQALLEFAQLYGTTELQDAVSNYDAPSATPDLGNNGSPGSGGGETSGLDCDGLRSGAHDGFCATVEGTELSYFTRLSLDYEVGADSIQVSFYEPVQDAGSMLIEFPLNAGQNLSCQDAGILLQLLPPPEVAESTFLFANDSAHTDCTLSFSQSGRVLTGTVEGTLGTFVADGQTYELTGGDFRISLPQADDEIRASVGGTITSAPDVTIFNYRPEERVTVVATRDDINGDTIATWTITIADLSATGGQTDCQSSNVTYRAQDGSTTASFTPGDCDISFDITNGVLTGTFDGTLNMFEDDPFDTTPVAVTNGSFKVSLPDGPAGN